MLTKIATFSTKRGLLMKRTGYTMAENRRPTQLACDTLKQRSQIFFPLILWQNQGGWELLYCYFTLVFLLVVEMNATSVDLHCSAYTHLKCHLNLRGGKKNGLFHYCSLYFLIYFCGIIASNRVGCWIWFHKYFNRFNTFWDCYEMCSHLIWFHPLASYLFEKPALKW